MKYTAAILAAAFSVASAQFEPIADAGDYTALLGAVVSTGSDTVLLDNAPVTIFGPKDSAFDAISDIVEGLTDEELVAVLLDHVVVGNVTSEDVVAAGCIEAETAGGLMLGILYDADSSSVTVNGIPVTSFDIGGDYGVLHGIESVLVEGVQGDFVACPTPIPAIVQPIADKGTYGILLEAVLGTGLLPVIGDSAPVTIFGPKDSAFEAIQGTVENLSAEEITAVLLDHVIVGANVTAADVVAAGCIEAPTAGGLMLGINFDADSSTVTVNGIPVTDFDVAGDYGILHGIEGVLVEGVQGDFVPCPAFEADFSPIVDRGIYDTLLGAVVATGNDAVISANAPVTIFGPNDSAFAAIQETVDGLTTEELSDILLNHVIVGAEVDAATVVANGCTEAIAASFMNLAIRYDAITETANVNGIPISDVDIQGNYGIMHGIEGILLDEEAFVPCSVIEKVGSTGNYSTLLGFLEDPLLQGQLETVGPITIFGPSDEAFAAIAGDLEGIDQATLLTTLGGHVVSGLYTTEDVKAAGGCVVLDTIVGGKVRVMYEDDHEDHDDHDHRRLGALRSLAAHAMKEEGPHVMVNGAEVILADVTDATTVFHGLDMVLLGGETFECPTEAPVAAPTTAPVDEGTDEGATDSGSSSSGISAAMMAFVAVSAFVF